MTLLLGNNLAFPTPLKSMTCVKITFQITIYYRALVTGKSNIKQRLVCFALPEITELPFPEPRLFLQRCWSLWDALERALRMIPHESTPSHCLPEAQCLCGPQRAAWVQQIQQV
tara:strand:+ start:424 stop:765 length:342 start_codon:yes stop_codon:yes gene_type:complete